MLRGVRVASTGESFAEWCKRTVAEAPVPTDVQIMKLIGLFTQALDKPVVVMERDYGQLDDDDRVSACLSKRTDSTAESSHC